MKNENKYGKKEDVKKFKAERKQKPDCMSKRPNESHINTLKTRNGGTWYYCHRDTACKYDGQYSNHKPPENQGKMKRKPIQSSTSDIQGGD